MSIKKLLAAIVLLVVLGAILPVHAATAIKETRLIFNDVLMKCTLYQPSHFFELANGWREVEYPIAKDYNKLDVQKYCNSLGYTYQDYLRPTKIRSVYYVKQFVVYFMLAFLMYLSYHFTLRRERSRLMLLIFLYALPASVAIFLVLNSFVIGPIFDRL